MQAPSAAPGVPEPRSGTTTGDPLATGKVRRSWWRRAWAAPLWAHAALLLAVLVALIPLTRVDASFSSDEGAAILQAQRLAAGEPWLRPNELPTIDPDGKGFFITLSEGGPQQFAAYAKHPTYAWMLAYAYRVGGVFSMTLLSAIAAALAAVAGALIARRWDPGLDRWALWILGVGSPLLFDSQLVLAHTIGAALAGFGALLVLRAVDRPSWRALTGAIVLLCGCSLFRSEGLLVALSLAAAIGILGLRRRRPDLVLGAVGVVVASGVTTFADRWWLGRILGSGTVPLNTVGDGFLQGRLGAAATTFLLPGATWPVYAYDALVVLLLAVVGTALLARRRPVNTTVLKVGSVVVVVCAVLPLLATPDTINSVLITCPVVAAGWFLLTRRDLQVGERQVAIGTCVLYVVAVLGVQYSEGGAAEWGARFLAVILPMAVPIALVALQRASQAIPKPDRRWPAVALAVASLSMAILSVTSLRYYRGIIVQWNGLVRQAELQTVGPDLGDGDRRPIVVTTWAGLGRMSWPLDPAPRGLFLPDGRVTEYARRLRDHGVQEFVLATEQPADDLAALHGLYEPVVSLPTGPITKGPVFVMRAT